MAYFKFCSILELGTYSPNYQKQDKLPRTEYAHTLYFVLEHKGTVSRNPWATDH